MKMNKLGKGFDDRMKEIAHKVNKSWAEAFPEGRPPERIDAILERIRYVWKRHPQMRLCQLIENCFPHDENGGSHCIYYKEDTELYDKLAKIYLENSNERD